MPTGAPGARRPTIYDVAKHAGVSPSLVSLVLQEPGRVSEKRREAVKAAIAELGYRPSRAATALASSRTKSVGLVIDDYRNLWFVDLLRSMQAELSGHGYQVTLADSQPGEGRIQEAVGGLLAMHVDALVIAAELEEALAAPDGLPLVVAGWREQVPGRAALIASDDDAGGGMAAAYLLGLGHSAIAHLSGAGGAAAHRRDGFRHRILEAGLEVRIAGESGGTSEEDGYASACWVLDRFPDTTAIFAANDTMALGVLAALKVRGLTVPHDVSVLGYDNSALAKSRFLDITTIDSRSDLVGVGAARLLLARLGDPSLGHDRQLVHPELVVRSTTGARNLQR